MIIIIILRINQNSMCACKYFMPWRYVYSFTELFNTCGALADLAIWPYSSGSSFYYWDYYVTSRTFSESQNWSQNILYIWIGVYLNRKKGKKCNKFWLLLRKFYIFSMSLTTSIYWLVSKFQRVDYKKRLSSSLSQKKE